ncbi:O-antigen ligase family protein [Salinivibrio sp. AR640]|uniref:O-antigen ligase family protein n=1 Tax=Salinivibrio sp. AR640 TaxID=1909437 RepID=UPI0009842B84|nr:O-antigen ligase family protein [Salinivibrio sp. AR640]OOE87966.1 hypothetical protein BZG75_14510 [Salinivibrio sp. AR640]
MDSTSIKNTLVNASSESVIVLLHLYAYLTWTGYTGSKFPVLIFLSILALIVVMKYISVRITDVFLFSIPLFSLLAISLTTRFFDIYALVQIGFTFLLILFFTAYFMSGRANYLVRYVAFNIVVFFVGWLEVGGYNKVWIWSHLNPNVMGFFMSLNLMMLLSYIKASGSHLVKLTVLILSSFAVLLIIVSTARSVWLSVLVFVFLYYIFRERVLDRSFFNSVSLLFFVSLFFFPLLYVYLSESSFGIEIDTALMAATDKGLFTGREMIWNKMYEALEGSLFWGLGMGASNYDIGMSVSSHSLYMNLLFQFGIFGLLFFILMVISILNLSVRNLDNAFDNKNKFARSKDASLIGLFLISLLVQQSFELFLFQNNLPASFLFWCGLVLYYSQTYKNYRK